MILEGFTPYDSPAAALYEQAAARGLPYTRMADVLNSAARCRIALKEPGRAESLARQALEKDPGFWPALLTLGQVADARGDGREADRFFAEYFKEARKSGLPVPRTSEEIRRRAEAYLENQGL